ncbi:MAG TPA: DNA polymerase I [Minicystis sp.]|nr:DNA polymerase I [Minicystis sp.]
MTARPTALPPPGASDVLYLLDLSGYVFRAFHALPALSNPRGEPTNATYGTVSMLHKLVTERKPVYLGVAMDSPGRGMRGEIDPNYKATRPAPPDELKIQMKRCREFVEAYKIPIFVKEGLEADDLIAVAVEKAKAAELRVVIASSDKDLMQLVDDDRVMLWDAMRDKVYGAPEVEAKFGVPPEKVRDLLALVGDTSDNVPGVPGVGMKTAADLLLQFGSLDAVYARLGEVKKAKIQASLKEHEADARLSQRLVTLHTDVPVELDLEALRYGGSDTERLRDLYTELGFTRFVKMLPPPEAQAIEVSAKYATVLARADLDAFAAEVRREKRLAIELATTSKEPMRAHVVGFAFAARPGAAVYVPVAHRYLGAPEQLPLATVVEVMGPLLEDASIAKIGHDTKFADVVLSRHGMKLAGVVADSMLASYLLDPEAPNQFEIVADRDAQIKLEPLEIVSARKKQQGPTAIDEFEVEEAARHLARYPEVAIGLATRHDKRLKAEHLERLLADLELPLSRVLADMERAGVLVDLGALDALGKEMAVELAKLEEKARSVAGADLNLASPKQLENVLFDVLKLRVIKKTKTGRSTDAEVLEALSEEHPLPGIVLEHRAIAKLKGTYVDALPKLVHPETGRIHTRWSQAVAATGRLSSNDPNLQNIPIRSDLGKLIRRAFVAPKGSVVLSADYSQIELRVLAHLSHDPLLVDAFRTGQDVHVRTAMEVFGVDAAGVTEEMRRRSKTVNFGIIYGMGEVALAKRLSIPRAEAAKFIERYFEKYKGVHDFMERTMADARRTEIVHTLLGRRRHLPDLRNSDRMRRAYAERIAQNTPIQGTAADLLKLAMVKLGEPVVPGARMVLTVHDELAFEVPRERAEEAAAKVRSVMEGVYAMDVPLVVDVGWGDTWADA